MTDFDPQTDTGFLSTASPRPESDGGQPDWSSERARMLGALIEKALATPQNYPLTRNALTAACNQTTNRDPIMDLSESAIRDLLDAGKVDGLLRFVHPRSGRGVTKYRHVVDEALGLSVEETALIGVLLLRGPQTVNELRTRTERLAGFVDNEAVESTLRGLAERSPQPLARLLARETGHREPRWIQLLCRAQGEDRVGQPATNAAATGVEPGAGSRRADIVAPGGSGSRSAEIDSLRAELAATRLELATLRAEFEEFRAEFG